MTDIFTDLGNYVEKFNDRETETNEFRAFEPWDCDAVPNAEIMRRAAEDGIDLLNDPDVTRMAGTYPRLFQSGIITSTKRIACSQGGSQVGKTLPLLTLSAISVSHQIPHSLRHERGVDTEIKRPITPDNIGRFGRFDAVSGDFIDKNRSAHPDPASWNCGNIIGAGMFPTTGGKFGTGLLAPPGSQIWIGTLPESVKTYWWKKLAGSPRERYFPDEFINRARGNMGYNKDEFQAHCMNECSIFIKRYGQGADGFETEKAFILIFDEEPTNPKIWRSGDQHCHYMRMAFTPLHGITWSKQMIFGGDYDVDFFHATQYDSPYQDNAEVDAKREGYRSWDRKIVIWGMYSEQVGEPFYDRGKINLWLPKFTHTPTYTTFEPQGDYYGIKSLSHSTRPGLLDTVVKPRYHTEGNLLDRWCVYEDRQPGFAYCIGSDQAEGDPDPDAAADFSAACIGRSNPDDPDTPIICATLRTSRPVLTFARYVLYAARWYNNAHLAPEIRGTANATFMTEVRDWPHWFNCVTKQESTGKNRGRRGFDTTAGTRESIYNLVDDWMNGYEEHQDPMLRDHWIMYEAAAAINGKKPGGGVRCDHPRDGTLDSLTAFAILLYAFNSGHAQFRCNEREIDRQRDESAFMKRVFAQTQPPKRPAFYGQGASNLGGR